MEITIGFWTKVNIFSFRKIVMVNQEILHSNISSLRGGICLCGFEFTMSSGVFLGWLPWHTNTEFNDPHKLGRYEQS